MAHVEGLSDFEIIARIKREDIPLNQKKVLEYLLYSRYLNLVHKNWSILLNQLNRSSLAQEVKEDFYEDSYLAFLKALKAVNLEKVQSNYQFTVYFNYYLKGLRAQYISKLLRQYKKEAYLEDLSQKRDASYLRAVTSYRDNPDEQFSKTLKSLLANKCIHQAYEGWSAIKKTIFDLRCEGVPKKEIAQVLGITPSAISYHLKMMPYLSQTKIL